MRLGQFFEIKQGKKNQSSRLVREIQLEQGHPRTIDWSPEGTRLVVGDSAGGVQVFTADGKQLWRCKDHSSYVKGVSWAPDRQRIASASSNPNIIQLYDANSGTMLLRGNAGFGNWQITWSPDSHRLAWYVEEEGKHIVRVFNANTGTPLMDCVEHYWCVKAVSWSSQGHLLASGSEGNDIIIWDTRNGSCLHLIGHSSAIYGLSWSPDGCRLASTSADKTLRVWDTRTGKCELVCKGHKMEVWSVSWSPDGLVLASGSEDSTIRLWDARNGDELLRLAQKGSVLAVDFQPYGIYLASAIYGGPLIIWDVSDFVHIKQTETLDIQFQQYIAMQAATIGYRPPPAKVKTPPWVPNLPEAKGDCLGVLKYHTRAPGWNNYLPSVAMFPDGRSIATGHGDGTVCRWDLQTGTILWQEKHTDCINDIAVSLDGTHIATASWDKLVRTWDSQTSRCLRQFMGHSEKVLKVRWSPDRKHITSIEFGSTKKQLRTWDVETGQCLWIGEGHNEYVQGLDWSANGRFIATSDRVGNIVVWDADSGQKIRQFNCHNVVIWNLHWSPDSRFLLAGFVDGTILIMNSQDGSVRFRLQGHTDGVSALDWSQDGRFIATGSRQTDRTLRIWDAETGQELKRFTYEEDICYQIAFPPDSAFIVASLKNKGDVFRIWDTRDLLNKIPRPVATEKPSLGKALPEHLKCLPPTLAQMHRLNIFPPLSLIRDILELLADHCTVESLKVLLNQNSAIQALRDLHWPFAARIGLVTLLLHNYPPSEWKPQSSISPSQVRDELMIALTGEPIEPQPPMPPISLLTQAAEIIDDRLLSFLSMLGPDSVAADPGIPLRLLPRVKEIPPLSISQRRQLGIQISTPGISGQSTGLASGADRGQIGDIQMGPLRSDFTSLLPTQLALPSQIQMYRHLRNELLFRAREMAEPQRLRPTVILLDVSPSTFGPIEKLTRLAAFTVAQSLNRAGLSAILLTNSDGIKEGQWLLELKNSADLVEIWLQRTLKSIPASRSLELARVLRAGMQENDGLEPIILVLSHPWFGSEEKLLEINGLRGLFVQYPNYPAVPVLAGKCQKWKSLETGHLNELADTIAFLMS